MPFAVPLPPITSHALSASTADDVRAALRSIAGYRFEELWQQVCRTAQLPVGCHHLDERELEALVGSVSNLPGRAGLAGRDVGARVAAHRALSRAAQSAAEEPAAAPAVPAPVVSALSSPRAVTEMLVQGTSSTQRLDEIAALDLFSPSTRRTLDAAARAAAEAVGADVGLVSIVLDQGQVFAGSYGLQGWLAEAGGTPVEWSFCTTAVRTRAPYLVPDAARDVLQRRNPLVLHDGVASYMGVPLLTSSGQVLGACCVIHGQPRAFTPEDVLTVQTSAADVVRGLELRRSEADRGVHRE